MLPLKIILLGGSISNVNTITEWMPRKFNVWHYHINYQLTTADLKNKPALIFIVSDSPDKREFKKLLAIRKKLRLVPVIFCVNKPTKEDILSIFRLGAKDVLSLPLKKKEFITAIRRNIGPSANTKQGVSSSFNFFFHRVQGIIKSLFRKKPYKKAALRFVANETIASVMEEDNNSNYDIKARFFGGLEIEVRGKKMEKLRGKKIISLLAYLLYYHKKPVHRDKLMEKFWGNTPPSSARNSLNVAMHAIRRYFYKVLPEQDILVYQNECYSINADLDIITDVELFTNYWQKGRSAEQVQGLDKALGAYNKAIALYRGDFMENTPYEEWCEGERDNLKETYLLILDRKSSYFFDHEAYGVAINICKKMIRKDACLEDIHRKLIICYQKLGHRDKAIRQYHKCFQSLKEELGVEPSDQTKALVKSS